MRSSSEAASWSRPAAVLVAAIECNVPDLTTARALIDDFQTLILEGGRKTR
jgi:hypothetical protein